MLAEGGANGREELPTSSLCIFKGHSDSGARVPMGWLLGVNSLSVQCMSCITKFAGLAAAL